MGSAAVAGNRNPFGRLRTVGAGFAGVRARFGQRRGSRVGEEEIEGRLVGEGIAGRLVVEERLADSCCLGASWAAEGRWWCTARFARTEELLGWYVSEGSRGRR